MTTTGEAGSRRICRHTTSVTKFCFQHPPASAVAADADAAATTTPLLHRIWVVTCNLLKHRQRMGGRPGWGPGWNEAHTHVDSFRCRSSTAQPGRGGSWHHQKKNLQSHQFIVRWKHQAFRWSPLPPPPLPTFHWIKQPRQHNLLKPPQALFMTLFSSA